MKIYIYQIYFPSSKKCYMGQTSDMKRRMSRHLDNKSLVGNALRKYDDWTIEILHTCKTRDEANRTEIEEIRHYNCVAPNGYNLTRGGDGIDGYKWTEEQKQNQSERFQGTRIGKNGSFYGKHHSEEWCKSHSEKIKGTKNPAVSESNKRRTGIKNTAVSESNKTRKRKKLSKESIKRMKIAQSSPEIKAKVLRTKLKTRIAKLEQGL